MARTLARAQRGATRPLLDSAGPSLHHAVRSGGRVMARAVGRLCTVVGVVAVLLITGVQAAGADIVSPPGACVGSGTWTKAVFTEVSTNHTTGDVIKIPQ